MGERMKGERMKVLVVDDDPGVRDLAGLVLAKGGFDTDLAGSVAAAQAALQRGACDVVLADKNLPDGSGFDLARWLQRERPEVAVALLTGEAGHIPRQDLALVDAFLGKPFRRLDDLVATVAQARQVHQARLTRARALATLEHLDPTRPK